MFGNNRKSSTQTSVYSEYEYLSGFAGKQALNDWLRGLSSRKQYPSPRFDLQRRDLPNFGKKSSVDNFTLGQIEDTQQEQSPDQRMDTFPANEGAHKYSVDRLSFFDNKENNSLNANAVHLRESTYQSKSFVSAMRALQYKCKRLEQEKYTMGQEYASALEQFRTEGAEAKKKHNQLQSYLEQKAVESIEMKSRLSILYKSAKDSSKLIQENGRLKDDNVRLERKVTQSEKCNIELSEKYAHATKQYELQCKLTAECEERVAQLEQLFNELRLENQDLREINGRLERCSTNNELVSRHNALIQRNQELSDLLERAQQEYGRERDYMRGELNKLKYNNSRVEDSRTKQVSELERQCNLLESKLRQHEQTENKLRGEVERKNQEMLYLMKGMLNKAHEKPEPAEFWIANTHAYKQREEKVPGEASNHQPKPYVDANELEWGYKSAADYKITSRFEVQSSVNRITAYKDRNDSRTLNAGKAGKQRSLEKPKHKPKESKSYSKSLISSKYEEHPQVKPASPRHHENFITFYNPFKRGSHKKSSRRVVYASSQPREVAPACDDLVEVHDFEDAQHRSQFCYVHNPASVHVCDDYSESEEGRSKDLNKMLLIEAEKEAIMLFEEHEHLLNASKECTTSSARAEYVGRLKQLNEQIRLNSEKICYYKSNFKRKAN